MLMRKFRRQTREDIRVLREQLGMVTDRLISLEKRRAAAEDQELTDLLKAEGCIAISAAKAIKPQDSQLLMNQMMGGLQNTNPYVPEAPTSHNEDRVAYLTKRYPQLFQKPASAP